jgi:predicted transposase YbfD/YdcC
VAVHSEQRTKKTVEVGRKENEISKAHEALKLVNISGKVLTGDAMHTQKTAIRSDFGRTGRFSFLSKKTRRNCTKIFSPLQLLEIRRAHWEI